MAGGSRQWLATQGESTERGMMEGIRPAKLHEVSGPSFNERHELRISSPRA